MGKKLYWRELTTDGLLKEPDELGPYYDRDTINRFDGFDTEEEAIESLEKMKKLHGYDVRGDYVLVTIYSP